MNDNLIDKIAKKIIGYKEDYITIDEYLDWCLKNIKNIYINCKNISASNKKSTQEEKELLENEFIGIISNKNIEL